MARLAQIKSEQEGESLKMSEEYLPLVKFVVIPIALGMSDSGAIGIRDADSVASKWIEKGYKLLSAERVETVAGDRVQVLCTFVLE